MSNNHRDFWQKALSLIAKQISKPSFETWLKPVCPISFDNDTMVLEVPNEFAKDWLASRYSVLIKESLAQVVSREVELTFVLADSSDSVSSESAGDVFAASFLSAEDNENFPPHLNPKYTFETFIVGNSNRLAHAAALAAVRSPGRLYNPLFLHAGNGQGKTHLMQAIGHAVLQNNSSAKVSYVSSEKFVQELINSIQDDKTVKFRNKYRNTDVLLIDDIQFIGGKERTQEEFFHTFNALYEANKQIVISSTQPPKQIPVLEEGLRSRFEGGIVVEIQSPDFETRAAILTQKAESENLQVPKEFINYIAEHFQSSIRELEGAFNRVVLYSAVIGSKITEDIAREALQNL